MFRKILKYVVLFFCELHCKDTFQNKMLLVLVLPNNDHLQQVEDYVRGCP